MLRLYFWVVLSYFVFYSGCGHKKLILQRPGGQSTQNKNDTTPFNLIGTGPIGGNKIASGSLILLKVTMLQQGKPVSDATVLWSKKGNGELKSSQTKTNELGESSNVLIGTLAGKTTVVATIKDSEKKFEFEVETIGGKPSVIEKKSDANQPMVLVKDKYKNPVTDVEVSWKVIPSSASLKEKTTKTNKDGQATNALTLPEINGTYTVIASTFGTKLISTTFVFTVKNGKTAPPPTPSPNRPRLKVEGPQILVAEDCGEFTVTLEGEENVPAAADMIIPLRFSSAQGGIFATSYEACATASSSMLEDSVAFAIGDTSKKFYWRAPDLEEQATLQVSSPNKADAISISVSIIPRGGISGTLDLTFGKPTTPGFFRYNLNDDDFMRLDAMGIQSDGKIVLLGRDFGFNADDNLAFMFRVERLSSDGKQDSTFGDNGKKIIFSDAWAEPSAMAIQKNNDAIMVAGNYLVGTPSKSLFAIAKLEKDGALDTSFATLGKMHTLIGGREGDVLALAAYDDGSSIFFGGYREDGFFLTEDAEIFKMSASGRLKTDFGGILRQNKILVGDCCSDAVILAPNDRFLTAYSNINLIIQKHNKDGTLDRTFGPRRDGKLTTDLVRYISDVPYLGEAPAKNYISVGADGSFLVLGYVTQNESDLAKFDANGAGISSFANGSGRLQINGNGPVGQLLAVQPDGRILVAGYELDATDEHKSLCQVRRFDANGNGDASFGENGVANLGSCLDPKEGALKEMVVQENGGILLYGLSNSSDTFILRLWP